MSGDSFLSRITHHVSIHSETSSNSAALALARFPHFISGMSNSVAKMISPLLTIAKRPSDEGLTK